MRMAFDANLPILHPQQAHEELIGAILPNFENGKNIYM
jgi:hypothetical protein